MRLQDFEDDEFGEALEAGDQLVLLQHLGEDPEDQGPGGPNLVREVLQQKPQDRPRKRGIIGSCRL